MRKRKAKGDFKRYVMGLVRDDMTESQYNPEDLITMDVPLFIRILEYVREDIQDDATLHEMVSRIIEIMSNSETKKLTMDDYESIITDQLVDQRLIQLSRIRR